MINQHTELYRVVMPHYVCGVIIDEHGLIIEAAPIVKWSKGWHIDSLVRYIMRRGGDVQLVPEQC